MKNKINKIKNKGFLLGAILIFLSVFPFSSVLGANVFNPNQADHPLRIGNETQSQGTQNWQTSLSGVNAGDSLKFSVYFHNAGSIAAQNTNVRIQLSPIGSNTSFVATSTISATGFSNYTTTATMGLTSSQSIQFGNTATLYTNYNGSNHQTNIVPVNVSGNVVTYNLGTINPGYAPNDGYIIFDALVSNLALPNFPTVSAGPNKTITSGQSTTLNGTASHPDGLAMTYQWSCTSGSLSNSTILQPIFYAPNVLTTQTYSCTLTARDTNNNTSSSVTYITVNSTSGPIVGYPSVHAGPNRTISGGQSTTLNGTASHSSGLSMTYQWSCSDGSLSNSTILQPTFYAPNVSTTQTYSCTLTARDTNNNTSSSITYITVNSTYGSGNVPVVSAGGNINVNSGQSVILNGTAYHPNNLSMTYQWSCTSGSLSNSTILQPTFYAPSVSTNQTYSCTLTVRDANSNTASSVIYITVNPSGQIVGGQDFTVSTHSAENITSNSSVLKGKIDNDYGRNISVRFNWGSTSQYSNYSPWQYNKRTGDIFSFNLTGLEKGKAYHYRVEASDGARTVYGQNVSFVTRTDPVSNFVALASGSNKINLTWNNASQSCNTMIVKKTGSYPQHGADGTVIYYGPGNSYLDTGVTNNVWYYYKAWAVGCDQGLVSFSDSVQSRAYTISGVTTPVTPTTPATSTVASFSSINVEVLARNISKDQFSWQNSITASSKDKIEFKIVITPTGNKSLEDVKLITSLSDKIISIENVVVDGSTSYFDLKRETSFGTIKLGDSRVITFTGTMDNFNNQIINSVEISAKGVDTARRDLFINATSFQQGAAFMDIFGSGIYSWLLLILIILMALVMMYLILERNRALERREAEVKVEKSKYFNIK